MRGVDDRQRAAHGLEDRQRAIDFVRRMRGRVAGSQQAGIRAAGWRQHDVHVQAGVEQRLPHGHRPIRGPIFDRHDRRFGRADRKARAASGRSGRAARSPTAARAARRRAEDPQRRFDARDVRRRADAVKTYGRAAKCRSFSSAVVRHAEAADACQRLRERADDEVDLVEHALSFGTAESARAVRAERVRFVDHEAGAGLAARRRRCRRSGATSPLIEYRPSTTTRQRRGSGRRDSFRSQIGGRVVPERKHLRAAQPCAVVDARVALDVDEHGVVRPAEPGDHAEVGLIARS